MNIQRKKITSDEEIQMCVLFLKEGFKGNTIQQKILELGGKPTLYLPKQGVMCAQIKVNTAEVLKGVEGIRHINPVFYNSRTKKLRIKTDSNGNPLWRYEVDDKNNIYMVKNEK